MLPALELKKFENILAIRSKSGIVGYHSENQEVAELSAEAWAAMQSHGTSSEAQREILDWSQSRSENQSTIQTAKHQINSITINVNQVCNLHCTYCAAGGDGSFGDPVKKISVEKTLPQLKWLIEKLPNETDFSITFIGGEPLLYPEGMELIANYTKELAEPKNVKLRFTVVTNGTLLTAKNIALLKTLKANITISLDGPAKINDQVRPTKGGAGSTEKTLEGLRALVKEKAQLGKIGVSGVYGRHNMAMQEAYNFFKDLEVDWFDFTYDHTEKDEALSRAFAENLAEIAEEAFAKGGEQALRKIKLFDSYFKLLDGQQKTQNFCSAGKSYLIIDSRNNLYACPWMVGNLNESVGSGTNLFQNKLAPYANPLNEKTSCQQCWARNLCGGGCTFMHQNKSGSKNSVDNNFCERTRHLIAQALLYYERSRRQQSERLAL